MRLGDQVGVVLVRGVAGDVDDDPVGVALGDVEGGERAPGRADRGGQGGGRAWPRRAASTRTVIE